MKIFKRRLRRLKELAESEWVFKVDLMLDDFKILKERVRKIEEKLENKESNIGDLF